MRKIIIDNFGPVKKAELVLRDVNLLIGEQSVGKSTIAKLITILTDYSSLALLISSGLRGWENHLETYNLQIYRNSKYRIVYDLEERDVRFHMEIVQEKVTSYLINTEGRRVTNKKKIGEALLSLKPIFHKKQFSDSVLEVVEKLKESQDNSFILSSLKELLYNSLYIPAERIVYALLSKLQPALNLMKDSIPTTLLRFMIELANAQGKYPTYDASLLNIQYLKESSEEFFIDGTSHNKYHLSNASSGIQSTLPLLLVLDYAVAFREYSSFVIEEPETNLFPAKQVELLYYILKTVKNDDRTITITTHSPYLLSAMNNCLYAGSIFEDNRESTFSKQVDIPIVLPGECSVYSLGETINVNKEYCTSLLDNSTGMIDTNALDRVSFVLSEEFESLMDMQIEISKTKNKSRK